MLHENIPECYQAEFDVRYGSEPIDYEIDYDDYE